MTTNYRPPLLSKWWKTPSAKRAMARAKSARNQKWEAWKKQRAARQRQLDHEIWGTNGQDPLSK